MSKEGPEWKSPRSSEEINRLNKAAAERLGLTKREENNRDALLEGIEPEVIAMARDQSENILAKTLPEDRREAERRIDDVIRNKHPKGMISYILSTPEEVRELYPVDSAAVALAFLTLTENS